MPGSFGSAGGGSRPWSPNAPWMVVFHGFASRGPHTASARRPPGRSTRRVSARAAAGSGISISPQRHSATSKLALSRSIACASTCLNSTFRSPSSAARRSAAASIRVERSVATSRPLSPISSAARKPVSPGPAAISSTDSPGAGAAISTSPSPTAWEDSHMRSRLRSQPRAAASHIASGLGGPLVASGSCIARASLFPAAASTSTRSAPARRWCCCTGCSGPPPTWPAWLGRWRRPGGGC